MVPLPHNARQDSSDDLILQALPIIEWALRRSKLFPQELDDVRGYVRLAVVKAAGRFDHRCKFTTFIIPQIQGAIVDWRRTNYLTRGGRGRSEESVPLDAVFDLAQAHEDFDSRIVADSLFARAGLTRTERRAVELRAQGYTRKEIGDELGVHANRPGRGLYDTGRLIVVDLIHFRAIRKLQKAASVRRP